MPGCIGVFASGWIRVLRLTGLYRDEEAVTAQAINGLVVSIDHLRGQEDALGSELSALTQQIKGKRSAGMKALKPLLLKCKQKRVRLTQIVRKRESFEHHLDVLNNTEIDQTLITTVKQTATAMKSLGIHKQIDDVDTLMSDLEDSHLDAKEMSDLMSSRLGREEDLDDAELEEELKALLEIDEDDTASYLLPSALQAPPRKQTMAEVPQVTSSMVYADNPKEDLEDERRVEVPLVPIA
ncbi:hypothetical protein GUITHDRAFT_119017 [Guillardia theta CCMP2712]|uniref:Uncharacterized protein n=1 Tax=Guillardia theta (strain CCMP2712) TaxID=905079 RepID=L1IG09_GUITC|nr:hypothetical protein GUITHDRAFT_119017 [Guillardia theta CCMP2712]EKX34834.1 hypothetical protein GUITHDRAFT_119017 [Guillardia theta CCMP2712]|eukprot:XP_005821814.1 hypothetical protein GUITHDRAFT_119017 [Guillardia theta CCMP2712]